MLTRLTYASQLSPDVTSADLDELVAAAASFNMQRGITGLLAVEGDRVCQTIEGPAEEVAALYERIRQDARHGGVIELDRRSIAAHHFADWGMVRGRMLEIVEMAFAS